MKDIKLKLTRHMTISQRSLKSLLNKLLANLFQTILRMNIPPQADLFRETPVARQ
jgi:hypothetical protein